MLLKLILKLYPPAWRQRYQEEMLALLELHPLTWRTLLDLFWGALDARLDPGFNRPKSLFPTEKMHRLRQTHSTIFWAFPLLVLGHLLFLDELDDVFQTWNRVHPALSAWKTVAGVLMAIGFLAFLLTGLLLACLLARQVLQTIGKGKRALLFSGVAVALSVTCLSIYVPMAPLCPVLLLLTACPFALAFAIWRYELPLRSLRYALAPAALVVAGMMAQLLCIAVWGAAIWNVSTQTVQQMALVADRHLWPGGWWHAQLLSGLLWMALTAGLALWQWGRGMNGLRRKETSEAGPS
jgi:hypothetical protein